MREKPERRNRNSACCSVFGPSIHTISVRGTITSRAIVSPSAKTEWIMSRSPCSTTPRCSARSTSSRSSTWLPNGPSGKPLPGVTALPIRISSDASGFSARPSQRTSGAVALPTAYACCRPIVRGATPTTTKLTSVIAPAVTSAARQPALQVSTATSATSVVAVSSQSSRSSSSRLRWRTTSPATAARAAAPRCPSRAISAARAEETVASAASVIEARPASSTSSTA